jgi:hypothetical protein
MGYSHYWRRPKVLDPIKFAAAVADCRKVCSAVPIPLGDGSGENEPIWLYNLIAFNGHVHSESFCRDGDGLLWPTEKAEGVAGIGKSAEGGNWFAGPKVTSRCVDSNGDGSYESFILEPDAGREEDDKGLVFDCCKTNYRPYDLCVQFCLIVFKEWFGDEFLVTSDGSQEQWNEAADGCQVFLGYGLLFELDSPAKIKALPDKPKPIPADDTTEYHLAQLRKQYPWAKPKDSKTTPWARAAANLRKELRLSFPGIKFSVQSDSYSMGNSVSVRWAMGPTTKEVEAIANKYEYGTFDGMTDTSGVDHSRFGEAVEEVLGRAKHVSCSRSLDNAAVETAGRALCKIQRVEYQGQYTSHVYGNGDRDCLSDHVYRMFSECSLPAGATVTGVEHAGGDYREPYRITWTA